jgi:hypothetical protein
MMHQIMRYDQRGVTFWSVNSHVPQNQRARIERQILGPLVDNSLNWGNWQPNWPIEFPLFAPYAATAGDRGSGHEYSQVRWSGNGVKYYCHRAAYVHQHGPLSISGPDVEISHTRFLGIRTAR